MKFTLTTGIFIRSALLWPKLRISAQIASEFEAFHPFYASKTHFKGLLQRFVSENVNTGEVHFYIQGEKISIHVFDTWMLISCFKNVLPHGEDLMVVPSVLDVVVVFQHVDHQTVVPQHL